MTEVVHTIPQWETRTIIGVDKTRFWEFEGASKNPAITDNLHCLGWRMDAEGFEYFCYDRYGGEDPEDFEDFREGVLELKCQKDGTVVTTRYYFTFDCYWIENGHDFDGNPL
jgi:hypothetical protein